MHEMSLGMWLALVASAGAVALVVWGVIYMSHTRIHRCPVCHEYWEDEKGACVRDEGLVADARVCPGCESLRRGIEDWARSGE